MKNKYNKIYVIYKNNKLLEPCFGKQGIYFKLQNAENYIKKQVIKNDVYEIVEYNINYDIILTTCEIEIK